MTFDVIVDQKENLNIYIYIYIYNYALAEAQFGTGMGITTEIMPNYQYNFQGNFISFQLDKGQDILAPLNRLKMKAK